MTETGPLLSVEAVHFRYTREQPFLGPLNLSVPRGVCWGIVGPNGAGKTTLVKLIAGLLTPDEGTIRLEALDVARLSARERARRMAYLPQQLPLEGDFTVRSVVLLGRYPHRTWGFFESFEDRRIAEEAMAWTDTLRLADRRLGTLSGGEAQRVHLAGALAQQPRLLLLDEPTASLDLRHQVALYDILRTLCRDNGLTAVCVTHDVNLAAQFCEGVTLMHEGRAVATGPPEEVMTPEVLSPVFGVKMVSLRTPTGDARAVMPVASA